MRIRVTAGSISAVMLGVTLGFRTAAGALHPWRGDSQGITVTVGPDSADVIGTDNVAIQEAIDRVAQAGGGTVLLKAGTYLLRDAVRLANHVTLRGERPDRTILKKIAGVKSRLKLDADYGEFIATVESGEGFAVGDGVAIVDEKERSGWTPSVRTVVRIDGPTLRFDRFLHMDYSVARGGRVFNTFPLIAGYEVSDVRVKDLTVDGSRADSELLDGCQTGGIYFFHSTNVRIRNCIARNYPGDGISTQFVEDPVIENCEAYGNAYFGIHLGTGALRAVVRQNRAHDNGQVGLFLCWRVQQGNFERNQCWRNGEYGISLGHKDTDNSLIGNVVSSNGKAGIHFRDESEINAPHRNTLRENVIEDNGQPGVPGYGVRIEGATKHIRIIGNTIRDTRKGASAWQRVGIYIGPHTDYITAERNVFDGNLRQALVNESRGTHNRLEHPQ